MEKDFREPYQNDKANQARESWAEYWSWVNQFYKGNFLSEGWTAQSTKVLAGVKNDTVRNELRAQINDLGRRIAAEWSKDNGVRKINTQDLQQYARRFFAARKKDDGSGKAIREEIAAIRAEVLKRMP